MSTSTARYLSLDVFRGITIALMIVVNTPGTWEAIYAPLQHAAWHGCTPTDLVFPSFMFAIGLSMFFSFAAFDYKRSPTLTTKILKRVAVLYIIYFLMCAFPFYDFVLAKFRIFGVLPRLAFSYGIGAFMVLTIGERWLPYLIGFLLLAYWAIMAYFGDPAAPYGMTTNAGYYLDLAVLGEPHMWHGEGVAFEPEGILSTLPAICTVLLGYLTGKLIKTTPNPLFAINRLLFFGSLGIMVALLWHTTFPINKKLWTSSYVLYAAAIDAILVAVLVWIIDVRKNIKWAWPFRVMGSNARAAYVISEMLVIIMFTIKWLLPDGSKMNLYKWCYQHLFATWAAPINASLAFALVFLALNYLLLWGMYRRGWFWKA